MLFISQTRITCAGDYTSSILGELPRNGKVGWCWSRNSSNTHIWKFSIKSKASGVQTEWEIKAVDSLLSFQPHRICLPSSIARTDCRDCRKTSQTSCKFSIYTYKSAIWPAFRMINFSFFHLLTSFFNSRCSLMKFMNISFMHQQLTRALHLCQACGIERWP